MEASQTNVEYPSPKPTDYENWFEYRYGVSIMMMMTGNLSILFTIAKVPKTSPNEKKSYLAKCDLIYF